MTPGSCPMSTSLRGLPAALPSTSRGRTKAVSQAAVVRSILGKAPLVENLIGAFKLHGASLLADSLRRDPQGDETVLTEGHAVVWVADDLQEEPPVAPGIPECPVR